jgi:hypothetical protein
MIQNASYTFFAETPLLRIGYEANGPADAFPIALQWYFNPGWRAGLQTNRRALCRLLWQLWSPNWHFTDDEFKVADRSGIDVAARAGSMGVISEIVDK